MASDWLCSLVQDHGDIDDDDGDDDDDDRDNDDNHGESYFFHPQACRNVVWAIHWRENYRLGYILARRR